MCIAESNWQPVTQNIIAATAATPCQLVSSHPATGPRPEGITSDKAKISPLNENFAQSGIGWL